MRQAYTSAAIGGMLLLTVIFGPVLAYFPIDAGRLRGWQQDPVTPIENLQIGEVAKVAGVITSPFYVAFGGAQRSGYAWSWNTSDVFTITDASGAATVTVSSTWLVMPGPHFAGWAVTSSGQPDYAATFYASGDHVTILGSVGPGSGTLLTLNTLIIGPTGTSLAVPLSDTLLPLAGLALFGFGWAWVLVSVADHAIVHRRKVRGVVPRSVASFDEQKDSSVEWSPNPRWISARPRLYVGLLTAGLGAWGASLWLYLFIPVGAIAFLLMVFFVIVLGMFAYLGIYLWVFQPSAPSAIAFSDRGFHFWYDSPYDRELHDLLIPWDSLQTIAVVPLPKGGRAWMMKRTDGEVDNMAYLTEANRNAAVSAWELHRPKGTMEASARGGGVPALLPDEMTLLLRRGANFQMSVVLIIFGGMFGAFLAVRSLTLNPADPFYPSELAGDIVIGGFFGILLLIGVVGALLTRQPRSLVVDQQSIRLIRANNSMRNISWSDVSKVGCGLVMSRAVAYRIDVYGPARKRPIRLSSFTVGVSRDKMAEAGGLILRTARDRGIPAKEYTLPTRSAEGSPPLT